MTIIEFIFQGISYIIFSLFWCALRNLGITNAIADRTPAGRRNPGALSLIDEHHPKYDTPTC